MGITGDVYGGMSRAGLADNGVPQERGCGGTCVSSGHDRVEL